MQPEDVGAREVTLIFGGRNSEGEFVEDRLKFNVMEAEKHQIFLDGRLVLVFEHGRWRIMKPNGHSRALVGVWRVEP